VPSQEWFGIGLTVAIASAAILGAIYFRAFLAGRIKLRPNTSMPVKVLALTVVPFILCGLLTFAMTHGVGDIATQLFGREHELTTELTKQHKSSHFFLQGAALERALPNHLCISEGEFNAFPRTGIYELKATQTKLGVHIKSAALSIH
jgi:hypothetical protein